MKWLNQPPEWHEDGGHIMVRSGAKTDFWRKTHSDMISDNGHFYWQRIGGDFIASVKVTGDYHQQYDQAGLMLRLDEASWLKTGIELFDGRQRVSVVVTHDYSDWSIITLPYPAPALWLRVTRSGGTIEIEYSLDGDNFTMMRQCHLTSASIMVGVMCASPTGDGFTAHFDNFTIERI
ncbi:MAG: DUF1349 domain-containing protein [Chloroflexi bacterium]|nr:MAG: DUF1349 domain-containing protein [Chloroflexota bacterium]